MKTALMFLLGTLFGMALVFNLSLYESILTDPHIRREHQRYSHFMTLQDILKSRKLSTKIKQQPSYAIQNCKPQKTLVFIKTHKTGSTTLSTVINRYGNVRNLSFLLFKRDKTAGHFRNTVPSHPNSLLPPVGVTMGNFVEYRNYDMMTSHIRFLPSINFLKRFMNDRAKVITILRQPTAQWESAFSFFSCARKMKNGSGGIGTFLKKPEAYWPKLPLGNCKYYVRNGMCFDMSSNLSIHSNQAVVKDIIKTLDEKIDLVLITEYIDESLILLKKMMCWDYEDIVYLKMNQRNKRSELTNSQLAVIKKWNMADILLYNHYNNTLWLKVEAYGQKFQNDLSYFRKMLKNIAEYCNFQTSITRNKHTLHFTATNESKYCQNVVKDDRWFQAKIIARQSGTNH